MSRVILVLALAVVVFVMVWFLAPNLLQDFLPQATRSPGTNSEGAVKTPAVHTNKPQTRGKPGTAKQQENRASAEAIVGVPDASLPPEVQRTITTPSNGSAITVRPVRRSFTVVSESAPLYSTNATGGPIVTNLRKGDVVEPQFILTSAGQEWLFVTVGEQRVSGFLRSDNLRSRQPAEQTSR